MSTETPYTSRTADKFVVRLPPGMRKLISEVARSYHRSMNSEIISRLENSLKVDPTFGEPEAVMSGVLSDHDDDRILTELSSEEFTIVDHVRRMSPARRASLLKLLAASE